MGLGALVVLALVFLVVGIVHAISFTMVEPSSGNIVVIFDFTFPDAIKNQLRTYNNCVVKVEEGTYNSNDGYVQGTMITFNSTCPIINKLPTAVKRLDMASNTCYLNYINSSTVNSTAPFAKCGSINTKWTCQVSTKEECLS